MSFVIEPVKELSDASATLSPIFKYCNARLNFSEKLKVGFME